MEEVKLIKLPIIKDKLFSNLLKLEEVYYIFKRSKLINSQQLKKSIIWII
jgi:hypothetical protein